MDDRNLDGTERQCPDLIRDLPLPGVDGTVFHSHAGSLPMTDLHATLLAANRSDLGDVCHLPVGRRADRRTLVDDLA